MPTPASNLGLNKQLGCRPSRYGSEWCDFSHLLVRGPALTDERLSLLRFNISYDIHYPSVDIHNSNDIAIIRAIIDFILGTGLCIWIVRHNVCHYLPLLYKYDIYILLKLYIPLLLLSVYLIYLVWFILVYSSRYKTHNCQNVLTYG